MIFIIHILYIYWINILFRYLNFQARNGFLSPIRKKTIRSYSSYYLKFVYWLSFAVYFQISDVFIKKTNLDLLKYFIPFKLYLATKMSFLWQVIIINKNLTAKPLQIYVLNILDMLIVFLENRIIWWLIFYESFLPSCKTAL